MAEAESRTVTVPLPRNGASTDDAPAGSMLGQLRARAAQARKERTLDVPVGGVFGSDLLVRYHTLPIDEMDRYGEMGDDPRGMASTLGIDMMVSACETVLFVVDGEVKDLDVGIDARLAEALGAPLPPNVDYSDLTPRDVVRELFSDNLFLLGAHLTRLVEWMQTGDDPGEA
jgi:hypothetical protein